MRRLRSRVTATCSVVWVSRLSGCIGGARHDAPKQRRQRDPAHDQQREDQAQAAEQAVHFGQWLGELHRAPSAERLCEDPQVDALHARVAEERAAAVLSQPPGARIDRQGDPGRGAHAGSCRSSPRPADSRAPGRDWAGACRTGCPAFAPGTADGAGPASLPPGAGRPVARRQAERLRRTAGGARCGRGRLAEAAVAAGSPRAPGCAAANRPGCAAAGR